MATVHPSRMGLIPQEMRETASVRSNRRSPSPRRAPRRSRSREQDRDRDRVRDDRRPRDSGYNDRRAGASDSMDRGRDGNRDRDVEPRRASPEYDDYRRPQPPAGGESSASAPWRQQDSMYPPKREYQFQGGGGGANFLEARRAQRAAQTANVWPPSPKAPARELSPGRKKSSKKSKRRRSPSPSDTDSSEEERRRKKKEQKRARRALEKEERKEKKRHRSHRHRTSEEESDDKDDRKHHRHRSERSRSRTRSRSTSLRPRSRTPDRDKMDVDRVEKTTPTAHPVAAASSHIRNVSTGPPPSSKDEGGSSDEDIGPQPMYKKGANKKVDERSYGGALLRGEGSAMAAFLQDGTESRIPRRGEIGLTSDEIAKYEDVGYVMSGSRHRRMNAVRMRKENQVISAEEKRGILKLQREERERKEAILRDEFSLLVSDKLKGTGTGA